MRKSLNEVLRDVVTLEVALSRKTEAHVLVRHPDLSCAVATELSLLRLCTGAASAAVLVIVHPQRLVGGRAAARSRRKAMKATHCC